MRITILEKFEVLKMNYCQLCNRRCCALEAGVILCGYRIEILNLKASRANRGLDTADLDEIIAKADARLDAACL